MQIRAGFQRAVDRAKNATEQAAQRVADKAEQAKDAAQRTADRIEANPHFQQGVELAKDAAEKAGDNIKQSGVLKKTEVKQAARAFALGGAQLVSAHAKHDSLGQAAALHTMKQQFALIGREVATAALNEPKRQEPTATSISSALTKLGLPADFTGSLSLRELFADPQKRGAADAILGTLYGKPADPVLGREATGLLAFFPEPSALEAKDVMKERLCDPNDSWDLSVPVEDGKIALDAQEKTPDAPTI